MLKPVVCNLGVVQPEYFQAGECAQVWEPIVGDVSVANTEVFQSDETAKVCEAGVCNLCAVQP